MEKWGHHLVTKPYSALNEDLSSYGELLPLE
ncbi:MAG: hypothetical protein ACI84K_002010, partial [Pseudohongiellaceae bacterium]